MDTDALTTVLRLLEAENNFLVASHENPDGDALGSTVAMGFILQALGKNFRLYGATGVPEQFSWLELPAPLYSELKKIDNFIPDWYLILDCGDPFRMGRELMQAVTPSKIINIDHHLNNPMFGAVNWVDPSQAAVGEMIGLLALALNIPLTGGLGEAIYLALVTDTGNFSYGNTKPETLELAASIIRLGLDPGCFNAQLQNQWSLNRLRLWAEVTGRTTLFCNGAVGIARVPLRLLQETGSTLYDCDGLVESVRRIKGVRVAIVLREDRPGFIKFSLRSQGDDNVQQVALRFSGGGHKNAAGGHIVGTLDEAHELLLEAVAQEFQFCLPPKQRLSLLEIGNA